MDWQAANYLSETAIFAVMSHFFCKIEFL
jgi:hypothetical protein